MKRISRDALEGAARKGIVLVLISNDDGIDSTGLHALVAAIKEVAEVVGGGAEPQLERGRASAHL